MPIVNFTMFVRRVSTAAVAFALACTSSACQSGSGMTGGRRPLPSPEAVPTSNLGLTVDEAYAAIPHRRTAMQFSGSKVPGTDQEYLKVAFAAIDQAVLLRVATFQSFSKGKTGDPVAIVKMDRLITFLQSVDPPPELKPYHKLIEQAVADQRSFFDDWRAHGSEFQYGRGVSLAEHPKVASSSSALKSAYGILMQKYSSENAHNKEAFFDYHCALDFL